MPRTQPVAFRLRIAIDDIEPPIWRTVLVAGTATLHELHRTIQLIFDWYDYHLYEFEVDDTRYEAPDEEMEGEDSTRVKLRQLGLETGSAFRYTYDFGDDWSHRIEIEGVEALDPDDFFLSRVLAGERRGPPEDAGGPHRYSELMALLGRPLEELDENERDFVEWLEPGFDPEEFSVSQANHALGLCAAWGVLKRRR
jgi:hypothetical protein